MFEQIYKDFSEKMLPEIAKGLTITKDYFTDLFGRYVHYLIVTDTFYACLWFAIFVLCVCYFFKGMRLGKEQEWRDGAYVILLFGAPVIGVVAFFGTLHNIGDLIKDIYIPEIRVYQEIKSFTHNSND